MNEIARPDVRILVVDDEEIVRESLTGWLEEDGYSVDNYAKYPEQTEVHGSSGIGNNAFYQLAEAQLRERSPKSWFRALFNLGLVRYIRDQPRMLPCEAGLANFFIYPYGDVYPCNGLEDRYWRKKLGISEPCVVSSARPIAPTM